MTAIATIDWNAKVNEALDERTSWPGGVDTSIRSRT